MMHASWFRCVWCAFAVLLGAVTAARADGRPNILFCIADDWSAGHSSADGCPWIKTPGFDEVARRGIRFTRCYTPNAKCAPSRSILLTGRHSWQLEAAANHVCFFPPKFRVYPEVLADAGYYVGYTGKGWGPGIAKTADGSPRRMTGRPFNRRTAKPPARGISNNDYAANFADFLDAVPQDQAWCFWYGATEPHRGYELGVGEKKAGKKPESIERVPKYWPDTEIVRRDMLDYAFEVEHFDRHVSRMLEQLKNRNQLHNTIVVVTSDHGMPFPRCKGQAYEHSNHVPFAIMWPDGIQRPGRVIDDFVSFTDVAPTFIEAAGLQWSDTGMAETVGASLVEYFRTEQEGRVNADRDHVLIGKERHDIGRPEDAGYPIRGIIEEEWLYLRNFHPERWPAGNPETGYLNCDASPTKSLILERHRKNPNDPFWQACFGKRPAEELYHIAQDQDCVRNLAADPRFASVREKLRKRMEQELKAQQDPRMEGKGDVFDRYPYANAQHAHFYERFMKGEKLKAGWVLPSDFEKPR